MENAGEGRRPPSGAAAKRMRWNFHRHVLDKEIWSLKFQLQTARLSLYGGIRFELFSSFVEPPMWVEHDVNARLLGIDIAENPTYYLIIPHLDQLKSLKLPQGLCNCFTGEQPIQQPHCQDR
jgi:hypothetical protein